MQPKKNEYGKKYISRAVLCERQQGEERNCPYHGTGYNQRDGVFDSLIPLSDKNKDNKNVIFHGFTRGIVTSRDAWCYNCSQQILEENTIRSIDFYNNEVERFLKAKDENHNLVAKDFINYDSTKFAWDRAQKERDVSKGKHYKFEKSSIRLSLYRPFCKQHCYFNRSLNNCVYQIPQLFPTSEHDNLVICVRGIGGNKDFSVLIASIIIDYNSFEAGVQCFPLYWYEENKNPQATLFDDAETNRYIRRDGITDWILKEVRSRFGGTKAISKEHIFYYVYGLLHSPQYRERFADDLKKSLPRIPIVDNVQDFMAFYKAGKELADLHLNYEQGINEQMTGQDGDYQFYASMPMFAYRFFGVKVAGDIDIWQGEWTEETYQHFAVEKMRFAKVRDENGKLVADKSKIIYNGHITIENIPPQAYDYIVNGKSAIEWIMERYAVTIDKASLIKNDPNDWSREHNQPRYILDLLLSVIMLSCKTVEIISELPKLKL